MPNPSGSDFPGVFPSIAERRPARSQFVPQFDAPFRLDRRGLPVEVEQDTAEEVGSAVYNVCVCTQGAKLADPGFGIPSPLFEAAPTDLTGILQAIRRLEPRVEPSGTAVLSTVAELIEVVTGGLYPQPGLFPGAGMFPRDGERQQTVREGPGTVDVSIQANQQSQGNSQ